MTTDEVLKWTTIVQMAMELGVKLEAMIALMGSAGVDDDAILLDILHGAQERKARAEAAAAIPPSDPGAPGT